MNGAYDAMMDLSGIVNVPPRALSLNGNLAISFGSRGSGDAMAHYEPDKRVIGLTKTRGVGSLAHEWFHALDNYFAGFKFNMKGMNSATQSDFATDTRPEIKEAFTNLVNILNRSEFAKRSQTLDNTKSKEYFSLKDEMGARSFENYILNKLSESGQTNDFLVNHVSSENWSGKPEQYPFPTGEETKAIAKVFDKVFETIQTKEESGNTAMYALIGERGAKNIEGLIDNLTTAKAMTEAGKDKETIYLATGWELFKDEWKYDQTGDHLPIKKDALKELSDNSWLENQTNTFSLITYRKNDDGRYDLSLMKKGATQTREFATYRNVTEYELDELLDGNKSLIAKIINGEGNDSIIGEDLLDAKEIKGDFEHFVSGGIYLNRVIDNPKLFKAYPNLKFVVVVYRPYSDSMGSLILTDKNFQTLITLKQLSPNIAKSTIYHEIQHYIQEQEGFAKGGSPKQFKSVNLTPEDYATTNEVVQVLEGALRIANKQGVTIKEAADRISNIYSKKIQGIVENFVNGSTEAQIKEAIQWNKESTMSPMDKYRKLAGEVEARNAQTRLDLTPEQRKQQLISATQDVAEDQKIYLMDAIDRMDSIGDLFKSKDEKATEKSIKEAQPIVDAVKEASNYDDEVVFMDNDKVSKDLSDRGIPEVKQDDAKKGNWRGVEILGKIYLHPNIANDHLKVIATTVHEKIHADYSSQFSKYYKREKYFNDLYNKIGSAEIFNVIPGNYWNDSPARQAEEYFAYTAENLVYKIKQNPNVSPDKLLNDLLSNIKDNSVKKVILDEINNVFNLKDLQNVIHTHIKADLGDKGQQSTAEGQGLHDLNNQQQRGKTGEVQRPLDGSSQTGGNERYSREPTQLLADFLVETRNNLSQKKAIPPTISNTGVDSESQQPHYAVGGTQPLFQFLQSVRANRQATPPRSVNLDVQARMDKAHGLTKTSLWDTIKEKTQEIKESFHHFKHITEAEFPSVYNKLRLFEAIPDRVKKEAYERMAEFVRPLKGKGQLFESFERHIVLQDLIHDIDNGLFNGKELPWGYQDNKTWREGVADIRTDVANMQKFIKNNPLLAKAVADRTEMMKNVREELVKNKFIGDKANDSYFHHQVIAYMDKKAPNYTGVSSKDVRNHKKGWQRSRTGSMQDYNTNYLESEFEVLAQSLEQIEIKALLKKIGKEINVMPDLVEKATNEGGKWRDYIPEGYRPWFPKQGTNAYKAASQAEKAVQNILNDPNGANVADLLAEAEGSMWVIPSKVADQLNSMKDPEKKTVIPATIRFMTGKWKQWILLNPYSATKYNFNNMSGDLDVVLAYNPAILKPQYAHVAMKEAWAELRGKGMSKDMKEALEQGIITSGLSVQEIPDVNQASLFRSLTKGTGSWGHKVWESTAGKEWDTVANFTQFRENILRVAAYKFFKEQIAQGKNLYAASDHKAIDALTDTNEKAGKLARELLGDYGNLSQAGQWLRSHSFPFWSWVEINSPRYYKMLKNTQYEGGVTGTIGRVAGVGVKKTVVNVAKLQILQMLLMGLVVAYNQLFWPDEDDELTKNGNRQLKLIVGRREDGSIMTMKIQGAFSDMLSFLGLEDAHQDFTDLRDGKVKPMKKVDEAGNAFVNKLAGGLMPLTRTLAEVATKKSFYPDIMNPRPVRNRVEQGLRIFKADKIYNLLTHKPARAWGKEVSNLLVYDNDPGEAAYFTMRQNIYDFMKAQGREIPAGESTERSNALYYYKQAVKLHDNKPTWYQAEDNVTFWLNKYKELGGTQKGYEASMEKGKVVSVLPVNMRKAWFDSLDGEEKEVFEMANQWYKETYLKQQ